MSGVTLYINTWRSRCGACNMNADPAEHAHVMTTMIGDGCGATYTHVSSDYFDSSGLYDGIREMRPDLVDALPVFTAPAPLQP